MKTFFIDVIRYGVEVVRDFRTVGGGHVSAKLLIKINGVERHTVAEGVGPVNAFDTAIKKAVGEFYPGVKDLQVTDFQVHILDRQKGTDSQVKVEIICFDGQESLKEEAVSANVIDASFEALIKIIDNKIAHLVRQKTRKQKTLVSA